MNDFPLDFYYYAAIYRLKMTEEKFMRSTIRQLDELIKFDRNYEKGILFEVISAINQKPQKQEVEVESILDL